MIQFSESYNAKTIFDQVWEAPYSWFNKCPFSNAHPRGETTLGFVHEIDEDNLVVGTYEVTVEMIEEAVIKLYLDIVSKRVGSWARNMSDYLEDMDANDVDAILQLACFKEIRYG